MRAGSFVRFTLSVSVLALSASMTPSAFAQDGVTEPVVLDEIVVTGEKVERTLDETASSVTVLRPADIAKQPGAQSLHEVVSTVPNVYFPGNVAAPVIRGQDTTGPNAGSIAFLSGTVPRASINVDGHYLNFYEYVYGANSIWDLKSIEVFRGPQTTSQGANAIAGAIIVHTNDPTFTPEAAYQVEGGSLSSRRFSGMVSGPLIANQLAGRIAFDYFARDTFIDYVNPGFIKNKSDQDFQGINARVKLLWKPEALPGFQAKLTYSYNDTNMPTDEAAFVPYDHLDSLTRSMPSWNQHSHTPVLDLSYDFGNGFKLFNQSQYSASRIDRVASNKFDGGATIRQDNISNESRLTFGNSEDTWSGMVGTYVARTHSKESLWLLRRGTTNVGDLNSFRDTKRNIGLFGEASYRLTDRWTLTGGARYENDNVRRTGLSSLTRDPLNYDKTFDAFLPKISLAYAVTKDVTVGALVSRGYNPGGVSLNVNSGKWLQFDPEYMWNYEVFTRARLFDSKLLINGNIFYQDIRDAQRYISVPIATGVNQLYTINADRAKAYGIELGLTYQALENLSFTGNVGTTHTKITKITDNPDYLGNKFQKAPGYMFSLGVSWDVTEKFNVAADVQHVDGYYSDDLNSRDLEIGSHTFVNARMSYHYNDQMEFYAYARNIFDEREPVFKQINRSVGGIEASMTVPRMVGVGLRGKF